VNRSNAENQVTRLAYDDAARLTYTIQVLAVDGTGNATKQVINRIDYDSLGNVVLNRSYATTQLSVATISSATLDAAVAAPAVANHPQNRTTGTHMNLLGRRIYAVDIFAVDSTGKATKHLITKQTYDALNRVVQTTRYATVFGALADYSLATLDTAVLPNSVGGQHTKSH